MDSEGIYMIIFKSTFLNFFINFYSLDSPSLHGKSVIAEESPMLTICDYQKGIISEQATFKFKVHKPKVSLQ